jgi:hypothetical protein
MTKGLKVLGIALMLVVSAMAADAPNQDVGKSWHVTFNSPMRVGATLLPAGDYKVQHLKDGDGHVLVFKGDNKQVAKVACTMEPLSEKPKYTRLTFDNNSAGERVLKGIAFEGDHYVHELTNP